MLEFNLKATVGTFHLEAQGRQECPRMGLFGPSGAGKTTLLHCIAGLIRPSEGTIRLGDEVLFDSARGVNAPPHCRRTGYVFQEGRLFPHMSVRKNIEYGRRPEPGAPGLPELAKVLDLERLLDRAPATLSGGERQRVALARSLAAGPRLLLMDEPLASVDEPARLRVLAYLQRVYERWRLPFVFVSHSLTDIIFLTERSWRIADGLLRSPVAPQDLLTGCGPGVGESVLNVLKGTVAARVEQTGYAVVACQGQQVRVPGAGLRVGDEVALALPARDVLLSLGPPSGLSARNSLRATIRRLSPNGAALWAVVEVGAAPLMVELTPDAGRDLRLEPGQSIHVVFKTHSISVTRIGGTETDVQEEPA
ncbi:MAG: molybdenum ABC transporter ATP-binding protein [Candidatus Brocadiia bacterium]